MPLVLFVGLPASGKTTRAKQLLAHLQQQLFPQQFTAAADESKQPDSSPAAASSLSTASSPLPLADLSAVIDDSKDSNNTQLSALSLTDPPPSSQPINTNLSIASSTCTTAISSSTSHASFTKSKARPKPATSSSSSSSSSSSLISELVLINHESLSLPRSTFYSSPHNEKAGRSAIRASVERHLTSSRILLVDYLNDIKGYRYEMWCRAREVGTTYCVVYCEVARERCVEWNGRRPVDEQYSDAVSAYLSHTHVLQAHGCDAV